MYESVLRYLVKCEVCGTTYMPKNGEVCKCPEATDEPVVKDWEDPKIVPQGDCYEQ